MALTREQKVKQIEEIKEDLSQKKSLIFIDFSKVPSKDFFSLRKMLKEAGCKMKVVKKTLARIAFGRSGISFWNAIKKNIPGQLALIFGFEDEISPAKIVKNFSQKQENIKILGGIFEGNFIEKEKVLELASLPSKQELLGRFVGTVSSPLTGFLNVLQGNIKKLVIVLSQIKK